MFRVKCLTDVGTCIGIAIMIPIANSGSWTFQWVPAFIGGLVGLLVGATAVAGGHYAQRTALHWPPSTLRRSRHRFAACSATAVTLLVSGLTVWATLTAGDLPRSSGEVPTLPAVLAAIAAVSYLFAYALAPSPPRVQHI